jgi:hypothetical protein
MIKLTTGTMAADLQLSLQHQLCLPENPPQATSSYFKAFYQNHLTPNQVHAENNKFNLLTELS